MTSAKLRKTPADVVEIARVEVAVAVFECLERPGFWRIETAGNDHGNDELIATFSGRAGRDHAIEYAYAKFAAVFCEQRPTHKRELLR